MSDEPQSHEPVLKSKGDAKFKAVRRKEPVNPEGHEPILMEEGFYHKKVKPPYLIIALVLSGMFIVCLKMWMHGGVEGEGKQQAQAVSQEKAVRFNR